MARWEAGEHPACIFSELPHIVKVLKRKTERAAPPRTGAAMLKMKISCLNAQDPAVHAMFKPFALKMEERRIPSIVINVFKC